MRHPEYRQRLVTEFDTPIKRGNATQKDDSLRTAHRKRLPQPRGAVPYLFLERGTIRLLQTVARTAHKKIAEEFPSRYVFQGFIEKTTSRTHKSFTDNVLTPAWTFSNEEQIAR
jgi:hypothetical protein